MTNRYVKQSRNKKDNDEFYTLYEDVESELSHYYSQLRDKVVYCNCDNPYKSQFVKYLIDNFDIIGLKRLIATSKESEFGLYLDVSEKDGMTEECISKHTKQLEGDGSFESDECLKLLSECDVVITNPPFSLFRKWYTLVMSYNKQILVITNLNSIAYHELIKDVANEKVVCGYTAKHGHTFRMNDGTFKKLGYTCWITTMDVEDNPPMQLITADIQSYQKYDDTDILEVPRVNLIPDGYIGLMGVPITFWLNRCRKQFKILGEADHVCSTEYILARPCINGTYKYKRLIIQRI